MSVDSGFIERDAEQLSAHSGRGIGRDRYGLLMVTGRCGDAVRSPLNINTIWAASLELSHEVSFGCLTLLPARNASTKVDLDRRGGF